MEHTDSANRKKLVRRLAIIEGQVRGLAAMIEKNTYCIDVIAQTSAARRALSTIEDLLLEAHLKGCVHKQMTSGQSAKAVGEVLKVYQLKR